MTRADSASLGSPDHLTATCLVLGSETFVVFEWNVGDGAQTPEGLSPAELEVLAALLEGASNAEIATRRRVSPRTVANQVASILRKLSARSRWDLRARYGARKCVTPAATPRGK